jgi:hypothetical protein
MSLLTPLYIAGVLAVALPVLFHLLRRAPQKKQTFSSLMFLAPTPPRFTRRSRISNWLLLFLRAAVLTLLAIAFARPFFRQDVAIAAGGAVRRHVAILLDTSASMRRDDLWAQAKQQVDQVLAKTEAGDEVALYFFDRTVRPAFTFEQWNQLDPGQRVAAVQGVVAAASPGWGATALGDAVGNVAEQLATANSNKENVDAGPRTLVLITDLQQGGRPEALQGHAWPDAVRLVVRPVTAKSGGNGSLEWIRPTADATVEEANRPRMRVTNSQDSNVDQFTVSWANANGPVLGIEPIKVYVPAGRGQVVRLDRPASKEADRLILHGDTADFDNTLFLSPPRQAVARVLIVDRDAIDDTNGLGFYVRTAFSDTPQRRVEVGIKDSQTITANDLAGVELVVVGGPVADSFGASLLQHAETGGDLLWVLRDPADGEALGKWLGESQMKVEESAGEEFSLLSRIDTAHPLFAAFADARFGDFSRVHFWKHRKLTLSTDTEAKTLASFDNGDPYLLEKTIGRGRLFVMTSGWQPSDSQLAVSTKFVPILEGLLRPRDDTLQETQYTVGDHVAAPANAIKPWTIRGVDGQTVPVSEGFGRPGIYTIETAAGTTPVAVNLAPDESRTMPVSASDFKQWGAKLEDGRLNLPTAEEQRQAQRAELENRQKLWQWLIVGVLGLIAAETLLAGQLARRGTADVPGAG